MDTYPAGDSWLRPATKRAPAQPSSALSSANRPSKRLSACDLAAAPIPALQESGPATEPASLAALPDELLLQILGYLPVPARTRCAQVCRRWHDLLTRTGLLPPSVRMAHQTCRQPLMAPYRKQGGKSPVLPGLSLHNAGQGPAMERPHPEPAGPPQEPVRENGFWQGTAQENALLDRQSAAIDWLKRLQHILNHDTENTDRPRLVADRMDDNTSPVTALSFSPCNNWLATAQQSHTGQPHSYLHIHGYRQGVWRREALVPGAGEARHPVEQIRFCEKQAATLFSAHSGGHLYSWHRQSDTGHWHATSVLRTGDAYQCTFLQGHPDGHLCTLYQKRATTKALLYLTPWQDNSRNWHATVSKAYPYRPSTQTMARSRARLALASLAPEYGKGCWKLHLWQQGLQHAQPTGWGYLKWPVEPRRAVLELAWSPDAHHLLALFDGGLACLWTLDVDCLPQLKLTTEFYLPSRSPRDLQSNVFFSQDSRWLALPCYGHQIRLWNRSSQKRWLLKETLNVPPEPGIVHPDPLVDDRLRYILVSCDGSALVRVAGRALDIWQRPHAQSWNRVMRYQEDALRAPGPEARLLHTAHAFCVTTTGAQGRVQVHAFNDSGLLLTKAQATAGVPLHRLHTTAGAKALGATGHNRVPFIWQMTDTSTGITELAAARPGHKPPESDREAADPSPAATVLQTDGYRGCPPGAGSCGHTAAQAFCATPDCH